MAKANSGFRRPIPARALRRRVREDDCRGQAKEAGLLETLGEPEVVEALRVGLQLDAPGYNVFVAGVPLPLPSGVIRRVLDEVGPRCPQPSDRLLVNDFKHPERPRLLVLPRGEGAAFVQAMRRVGDRVAESIRRLAEDETYAKRREEIGRRFREAEREIVDAFEKECHEKGFALGQVQAGPVAEPDVFFLAGDQAVAMGDLDVAIRAGAVPAAKEDAIRATHHELHVKLGETLRRTRALALERQEGVEELERLVANRLLDEVTENVKREFPYPEIERHLADARAHFTDRFPVYARGLLEAAEQTRGRPDSFRLVAQEVLREFRVNLVHDASAQEGCPLVVESHPTWTNLFGQIERDVDPRGNPRVDFLHVRAGSLLRADGGYLVLQVRDVLREPGVWNELKSVLRNGRLEIRLPEVLLQSSPTILRPAPIPVRLKVVLLGDEDTWYALREMDPDFPQIFKVKVAFPRDKAFDRAAIRRYQSFFRYLSLEEKRLHLDPSGLAAVLEEGIREAGRHGRVSVRFDRVADLVREADFVARGDGAPLVTGDHVRRAVRAAARRLGADERRVREAVHDGHILVQTSGARVGTVNGLAVYDFGDHRFGKVARITAAVGAGFGGVVNVERLAELSGSSHDKGVAILSGYLRRTFCARRPFAFTASLVFEQSYGGIDGDSATCAELFAILSALSDVPLRQDLAVTGSMNQLGDVQAVGGVNDKIEGFFDLCADRGLTGTQGVVIPRANVADLMLRHDVVEACAAGRFAIHGVDRVEEGLELLTGLPAGATGRGFRRGSVYAAVAERLEGLETREAPPPAGEGL